MMIRKLIYYLKNKGKIFLLMGILYLSIICNLLNADIRKLQDINHSVKTDIIDCKICFSMGDK